MKIVRSIVAVVVGFVAAFIVIEAMEITNFVANRPDNGKSAFDQMKEMEENPKAMQAFVETLPTGALVVVLLGWQAGAFLGGGVSALIAGRGRLLHAGVIGGLILAGTIFNALNMKKHYDFTHPDWMIVAGLLLPLPSSLLAGKIVSMLFPPPLLASNP
jgi:hypothetical protein